MGTGGTQRRRRSSSRGGADSSSAMWPTGRAISCDSGRDYTGNFDRGCIHSLGCVQNRRAKWQRSIVIFDFEFGTFTHFRTECIW